MRPVIKNPSLLKPSTATLQTAMRASTTLTAPGMPGLGRLPAPQRVASRAVPPSRTNTGLSNTEQGQYPYPVFLAALKVKRPDLVKDAVELYNAFCAWIHARKSKMKPATERLKQRVDDTKTGYKALGGAVTWLILDSAFWNYLDKGYEDDEDDEDDDQVGKAKILDSVVKAIRGRCSKLARA